MGRDRGIPCHASPLDPWDDSPARSCIAAHDRFLPIRAPDDGGEEEAYFYRRKLGYVIVARNYRSARRRGEIDLIGWERDVLCFIEVKTRTTRDVKPAEAAVNHDKQAELRGVAREYLRHLRVAPTWRFDVVGVYCDEPSGKAAMELFKNAVPVS
jgi:putative endonuclease